MIEKKELYDGVLMRLSSILFLLGLLTGIHVSMVVTGTIEGDLQASHINGIIGALIILSLILILPRVTYGNSVLPSLIGAIMWLIGTYSLHRKKAL